MISGKFRNCFHCGTSGAAAGAGLFAGIGGIMISAMGSTLQLSLVSFMVIGAGAVLAAYGFIEVGRWMAMRKSSPVEGDDEEIFPLRRYTKPQIS
jgi:hypothetical protein